jgi:hypothetical protein
LPEFTLIGNINGFFHGCRQKPKQGHIFFCCAPIIKYVRYDPGRHQKKISEIVTLEKFFGGGKNLTRIAIHILVKKGELLIWRKNGHFPHCAMLTIMCIRGFSK